MLILTLDEVLNELDAQLLGSSVPPDPSSRFPSISIDTRTLKPGQAFLAVRGPRYDGHAFFTEALRSGASCLISAEVPEKEIIESTLILKVQDPTLALQKLGEACRKKWSGPVIAVTGSMGKTTTRSFARTLLRERFRVLETRGNLNNEFGVPLSLLELQEDHQIAVLELGMSRTGEIRDLARICHPTAAVLTNVAAVHLKFFDSIDEIAEAKGEIIPELPRDSWLVYNRDDDRVSCLVERFPGEAVSFGFHPESNYRIIKYCIERVDRMTFALDCNGERYQSSIPMAGRHNLYNLAAATAVARQSGVSPEQVLEGYKNLHPEPMRGEITSVEDITVWDESYNSNPQAALSLLETISSLQGYSRKWIALGDMLELGQLSENLHRQLGEKFDRSNVDFLVTVGEMARFIREGALATGLDEHRAFHFNDSEQAAKALAEKLRPGDLLVIKGSRGMKMNRIMDWLKGVKI